MTARRGAVPLALILGAALLLQATLLALGFHRISFDESARALIARDLTWANALEPWIWPPLYKLLVGAALRLHDDVFLVPRLLSSAAGLLVVAALAWLAEGLFRNRLVTLLTALLAVLIPHRLVFAIAPMSDIYYYLFLILSSVAVLRWLRGGGTASLLWGCLGLLLAQAVRFEACFFAAVLMLPVLLRWQAGRLGLGGVAAAAALLFAFPAFWIADSWFWYGSLANLGITGEQFVAVYGRAYGKALRWSPLGRNMALDLLWNPVMLLGLWTMLRAAARDRAVLAWVLVQGLPLLVISLVMVATLSIPMAAPWRTTGAWALLLLPFNALGLVRLASRLRPRRTEGEGRGPWRRAAVAALLLVALLPLAARSGVYVRDGMFDAAAGTWREARRTGLFLREELARRGGGRVLIDSLDDFAFLDVIVGSGVPDRFVLTADAPPAEVAYHMPMRDKYLREGAREPIERFFSDRFGLDRGGDAEALARRGIGLVLMRQGPRTAALDASPLLLRRRDLPGWVLYEVRPARQGAAADLLTGL